MRWATVKVPIEAEAQRLKAGKLCAHDPVRPTLTGALIAPQYGRHARSRHLCMPSSARFETCSRENRNRAVQAV